jgi:adenosine deaminase
MVDPRLPLAELHLHLYGTIRAEDYLERLGSREVDWRFYEATFERAYGERPPLREILERHRAGDPDAARAFRRLFVFGDADAGNFARFQAKFNLLINGSELMNAATGNHADPVAPLAAEIDFFVTRMLADQRRQGIAYAEQRMMFGPPFTLEMVRRLAVPILERYAQAGRGDGITARLAFSLARRDPWPEFELVRELALGPHGEAVTGVDFCYLEEGFPPKGKAEFFAAVREFNDRHPERALAILYHVGESFSDKSLESAVRWVQEAAELGAHRLGHAIALGVDPELYGAHERSESVDERLDQIGYDLAHAVGLRARDVRVDERALARERDSLRKRPLDERVTHVYDAARLTDVRARQEFAMARVRAAGAVVEVCPTSNLRIGGIADPLHHPVHRFLEHGVPFVVASDDPGIFDTTVRDELDWVAREAGLEPGAVEDLIERAWRSRSEVVSGREQVSGREARGRLV